MATTQEIYEVTYSSPEIATLGDYLKANDSPAFPSTIGKGNNQDYVSTTQHSDGTVSTKLDWEKYAKEFCSYTNGTTTNLDHIIAATHLTPLKNQLIQLQKGQGGMNFSDIPLRPSIKFFIPKNNVDRIGLLTQGIQVVSNDEGAFKAKALLDLEKDSRYYPIARQVSPSNDASLGLLRKMYPNLTVWIWCRSLSANNNDELEGSFFDLTPFIQNITTSNGKNGGNFQMSLSPIVCEKSPIDGRWQIKQKSVNVSTDKTQFIANSSVDKLITIDGKSQSVRNSFFFHNAVTTNDVVFIRFETLSLEDKQRSQDAQKGAFYIDKNDLAGRIYDMIALVDRSTITIDHESRDVTIQIEGRDLSKLFIEDGTYFYALENKQGTLNFAGGSSAQNDLTKRLIYDNSIPYLGLYFNNSIENVLKFIIRQLSTIKVVPQDLFASYAGSWQPVTMDTHGKTVLIGESFVPNSAPDRRNTSFETTNSEGQDQALYQKQLQSKIDAAKTLITSLRKANGANVYQGTVISDVNEPFFQDNIYTALNSFLSDQYDAGNLDVAGTHVVGWKALQQLDANKNPVDSIAANTFPVLFTTYETQLFPVGSSALRKADTVGLVDAVFKIVLTEKNRSKYTPKEESGLAKGIWQIVKLVIDQQVTSRRICDSSISSANGSLLNFVRKICQEPFVEFLMDTYGDQYYLTVRKPPHDRQAMIDMITGGCYTEDGTTQQNIDKQMDYYYKNTATSAVVEVHAVDVIDENLVFDDTEVYSWYHFTPQGNFFGNTSDFSLSYIPALNFPEYADIWGSKPLDIVNNYIPYLPLDKQSHSMDYFSKQAFYDLKFLVESHQYLPFTRKGTIMINRDRRIKVGNPIRFKPTGEIFWVDSVSHSHVTNADGSIDATTTIQVSRGMIEAFIYGVKGSDLGDEKSPDKLYSYFTIINTNLNFNATKKVPEYKTVKVKKAIIKDAFGNIVTKSSDPTVPTSNKVDPLSVEGLFGDKPESYAIPVISAWQPSDNLYAVLKQEEGFRGKPYLDVDSFAIGYGSHQYASGKAVKATDPEISEATGSALLESLVLSRYFPTVKKQFRSVSFSQNELDALTSCAYNAGRVPKKIVKGVYDFKAGRITGEQLKAIWSKTAITTKLSPIPVPSLIERRINEVKWFLYSRVPSHTIQTSTVSYIEEEQQVATGNFLNVPDQSQVLNNFRVDQQIFNFFLRKQHFDYHQASFGNKKLDEVRITTADKNSQIGNNLA